MGVFVLELLLLDLKKTMCRVTHKIAKYLIKSEDGE